MSKLYAAGIIALVLATAGWGLIGYGRALERADNNETVAQLQSALMDLGLVIQKRESKAADTARKLIESEGDRINAITTNDHKTKEIKRLEQVIRRERERSKAKDADTPGNSIYYRIVDVGSFNRVWNEAVNSSELPASIAASVLQGGLSTVTGDDLARSFKYAIGKHNACAIKYNKLWRTGERLIGECNKKPPV